jgi:hypothetical protein
MFGIYKGINNGYAYEAYVEVDLCRSARSEVLAAMSMKIQVFWDVTPSDCLPVDTL